MTEFIARRVRSVIIVESTRPRPNLPRALPLHRPPLAVHRPHAERVALIEAHGALLYWDVLGKEAHPDAEIHDRELAADWLWEIYGPDAANALLSGTNTIATEWESPVLDAARRLAHLRWAEAWWPTSYAAGVPPLDTRLLRAEAAWRTAGVEHLLDDDEAVERALAEADATSMDALADHQELGAAALATTLRELAEDYGVELQHEPARLRAEDFALAAGGSRPEDLVIASGGAPIDWEMVPQGLVDAAAEATWTLSQRAGGLTLAVTVPAAPGAGDLRLTARIGTVEMPLRRDLDTGNFSGEAAAPHAFLLLPADRRILHVFSPDFAIGDAWNDPRTTPHRPAIIEFARERLTTPDTSLAERVAALDTP